MHPARHCQQLQRLVGAQHQAVVGGGQRLQRGGGLEVGRGAVRQQLALRGAAAWREEAGMLRGRGRVAWMGMGMGGVWEGDVREQLSLRVTRARVGISQDATLRALKVCEWEGVKRGEVGRRRGGQQIGLWGPGGAADKA